MKIGNEYDDAMAAIVWVGMDEPKRRVVCAALRDKNGTIVCGPRHWDSICRVSSKEIWEQGFVDQHGVFLIREEAWVLAEEAGQIIRRVDGDGAQLFSENIY